MKGKIFKTQEVQAIITGNKTMIKAIGNLKALDGLARKALTQKTLEIMQDQKCLIYAPIK